MNGNDPVHIDYFSDVLCVWAWIAQPRLEELDCQWGDRVKVRHHYVDIFGDCFRKIPAQWGEADGFEHFAAHVHESAAPFDASDVHRDIWTKIRPRTSAQAHLALRAAGIACGETTMEKLAIRLRRAFFCDAQDISNMDLLLTLAEECQCSADSIRQCLGDGSAIAAYSTDLRRASEMGVRGSPTWILNGGRQVLYGNVGYRILNANIEELLKHPEEEASWC